MSFLIKLLTNFLLFLKNVFYQIWTSQATLNITVMIDILQEIIKILQEKTLKHINLYWFHNDALQKNNILNFHSKEPRINE